MPLYTKTGDHGVTGLFGNRRVPKYDLRIEAYGTVDELNCLIGMLRTEAVPPEQDKQLQEIQDTLFEIGADLATEGGQGSLPRVEAGIEHLQAWIDASEAELPELRNFVLPGGHREAGWLHMLRSVSRRAERRFWELADRQSKTDHPVQEILGVYLNRLSDLFFSWSRLANHRHGVQDVPWIPSGKA